MMASPLLGRARSVRRACLTSRNAMQRCGNWQKNCGANAMAAASKRIALAMAE